MILEIPSCRARRCFTIRIPLPLFPSPNRKEPLNKVGYFYKFQGDAAIRTATGRTDSTGNERLTPTSTVTPTNEIRPSIFVNVRETEQCNCGHCEKNESFSESNFDLGCHRSSIPAVGHPTCWSNDRDLGGDSATLACEISSKKPGEPVWRAEQNGDTTRETFSPVRP